MSTHWDSPLYRVFRSEMVLSMASVIIGKEALQMDSNKWNRYFLSFTCLILETVVSQNEYKRKFNYFIYFRLRFFCLWCILSVVWNNTYVSVAKRTVLEICWSWNRKTNINAGKAIWQSLKKRDCPETTKWRAVEGQMGLRQHIWGHQIGHWIWEVDRVYFFFL